MDKNAIKKYAIWARRELLDRVSQRAMIFGITAKDAGDPDAESVNGRLLTPAEKQQRQALIHNIKEKGYEQVMEEVAYTWFNRFAALRFMEVNGYLPSHIRVFTNDAGEFKPQILAEAIHLDLPGLDMSRVYELESANKSEELFKYLLIVQCNALNSILPGMFQRIEDYTELLLPDYLLREGSVIEQMVTTIPEEDWTDQVQIIGWLYQYYNTEPKDKVFADLKKNIKITKENIPAATQLFTPDWIVHYMVENSLGRLWLEGHPNDALKSEWKYYLDEAQQEPEVQGRLDEIRKEYAALKPEEIRVIDPCMGSGHILCVLFDVLVRIYEDYGYTAREAAVKIVENNLWGLDIDDRAAQLSYFTVMMKARQYDRRFFTRHIQPHIYAIAESNAIEPNTVEYFCKGDPGLKKAIQTILDELYDAREYGSILTCAAQDWNALYARFDEISEDIAMHRQSALELRPLVQTAEVLAQQYYVVVTNPPYMGVANMSGLLANYLKTNYPDSKSDFFASFIERGFSMLKKNGYNCMVTMQSWMFLSSFENLREKILTTKTIANLMHMENMVMGIAFGTAVTSFINARILNYKGTYNQIKLVDIEKDMPKEFPVKNNRFTQISSENFSIIPGAPIAYWVSSNTLLSFSQNLIKNLCDIKQGLATCNNNKFLRHWSEVQFNKIGFNFRTNEETLKSPQKWYPYNKGGSYRKWYGNNNDVVNWQNGGFEIHEYNNIPMDFQAAPVRAKRFYFKSGITYGLITSSSFSARDISGGFVFDVGGSMLFPNDNLKKYILGLLCSKLSQFFLDIINPTLNYQVGDIGKIPIILDNKQKKTVEQFVEKSIELSKFDWDSFETSWDFKTHPLVPNHPGSCAATPPKEGNGEEIPLLRRGAPEGGGVVRNTTNYMSLPYNPKLKERARELRKAGNLAEVLLWNSLKRGQIHGLDFDRQKIIGNYIVDFYCASLRLVVEVDGSSHDFKQEYDANRDAFLQGLGLTVLHFTDSEVKKNIEGVVAEIRKFHEQNHPGTACHPSNGGELNHPGSCAATPPKEGNDGEVPLLRRGAPEGGGVVRDCYAAWEHECEERFQQLKANEEELNRIFIDIYGLQDELTPDVEDKDVTVRRADLQREVRSLISYAVGCMFGRYSLDFPGLVYAGGAWDPSKYVTFQPDRDAIIPICDDEYFEDDIVGRFVKFVELVYGKDTLEENLRFIADALGGRGSSREVIRNYFINDFYADHLKVYQKRPIYWLFDSGKKNGFKCLIYMHRYQPDTIARIRTDYVHEQQSRYRTALADLEQRINGATTSERVKLSKRLATLQAQAEEIRLYEEKIHHLADQMIKIDLDDGVKVNYAKFEDVLAKIK